MGWNLVWSALINFIGLALVEISKFCTTCLALSFHPNLETKKPTLILHMGNHSGPLQSIK